MRLFFGLLLTGAMCLLPAVASAEYSLSLLNRFSRWTGYGWSEGYHAYDECPPRHPHVQAMRPVGVWPPAAKTSPATPIRWQPLWGGPRATVSPPQWQPGLESLPPPLPPLEPIQPPQPVPPPQPPATSPVPPAEAEQPATPGLGSVLKPSQRFEPLKLRKHSSGDAQ